MAKEKKKPSGALVPSISRADLSAAAGPATGLTESALQLHMDKAEIFSGKIIVKPKEGEIHGPFRFVEVMTGEKGYKPKPTAKNKTPEPIDQYVGEHLRLLRRRQFLPIASAFVMKASEANLQKGDIIALKRTADYKSAQGGVGSGYELYVLARAGTPQAEKILKEYSVPA